MTEKEDDDILEKDVIANQYSEFFGNAYVKNQSDPEVEAADVEKATEGIVPEEDDAEPEEPVGDIFDDVQRNIKP